MRGSFPVRTQAVLLLLIFSASAWAQSSPPRSSRKTAPPAQAVIRQLKVLGSKDSVEIEIEASDRITPQSQVLTGPNRLVLDIPNAVPAAQLRSQSIYVGAVKDVRAGLFRSKPPTTRVVIDLDSPEPYQLFPAGHSVIIKLSTALSPAISTSIDPWREPAVQTFISSNTPATQPSAPPDPPKPTLDVKFVNGLLSIKADRVTLAEVLQAVQQRTGAEISLAPGANQDKVVVYLGPAPAQDVLARLLHGSKFNFLILNAASDPRKLDRVILTPRMEGGVTTLPPLQTADQPEPEPSMQAPMAGPPDGAAQFPPDGPPMPDRDIPASPDPDNPQ